MENTLQTQLLNQLDKALKESLDSNTYHKIQTKIAIQPPRHDNFGDYSTNVALILAKIVKDNPLAIAQKISDALNKTNLKFIQKIEVVKPGFINFFLDTNYIANNLQELLALPSKNTKKKIVLEHTSVNPNKALHIGHLRNAVLGDTLARLLKIFYQKVEVQNYIDDTGVQVADTVAGLYTFKDNQQKPNQPFDDFCWDIYAKFHKLLKENPEKYTKLREEILHELEQQKGEYYELSKKVVQKILDHHLYELAQFNISYDLLVYESHIIKFKLWDKAFELLKQKKLVEKVNTGEYAGCWVFTANNLNKILVRSNGTKVYTAKDIAYHMWKTKALKDFDFLYTTWNGELYQNPNLYKTAENGKAMPNHFGKADYVINIIDTRQAYPQEVVKNALEAILNQQNVLKHLSYGIVALSKNTAELLGIKTNKDQQIYHMSGRKGIGVKVKELLKLVHTQILEKVKESNQSSSQINTKAIAVSAIRYFLIRYTTERDIIFDINDAINIQGKTGPYLQYSYVRALNVLKKAKIDPESNVDSAIKIPQNYSLNKTEQNLLRTLAKFKDQLYLALDKLEPAILAEYAYTLSTAFNKFYETSSIATEGNQEVRQFRLNLTLGFLQTLKDLFNIFGIEAIEKM